MINILNCHHFPTKKHVIKLFKAIKLNRSVCQGQQMQIQLKEQTRKKKTTPETKERLLVSAEHNQHGSAGAQQNETAVVECGWAESRFG